MSEPIHLSPVTGFAVCGADDVTLSTAHRREATCPECLERTPEHWEAPAPSLKETRRRVARKR